MFSLLTQPATIGQLLDSGIKLFTASFKKVFLLLVVSALVSMLYSATLPRPSPGAGAMPPDFSQVFTPGFFVMMVVMMVVGIVVLAAVIFRIGNTANDEEDTLGQSVAVGLKKFFPMLIGFILYSLAMMIGMVLLVIPGIYLMLALSFFIYFLINENQGVIDSMKQSYRLVKGNWLRVATIFLAPVLLLMVLMFAIGFVAALILGVSDGENSVLLDAVVNALSIFSYPFFYSIGYVVFNDLKLRKSGSDLEARMQE